MKSKRQYRKGDRVLVKSFAGPNVCVVLKERYIASKSEHKLGVDGWEAQITSQKEIETLMAKLSDYEDAEPTMSGAPASDSKPGVVTEDMSFEQAIAAALG